MIFAHDKETATMGFEILNNWINTYTKEELEQLFKLLTNKRSKTKTRQTEISGNQTKAIVLVHKWLLAKI